MSAQPLDEREEDGGVGLGEGRDLLEEEIADGHGPIIAQRAPPRGAPPAPGSLAPRDAPPAPRYLWGAMRRLPPLPFLLAALSLAACGRPHDLGIGGSTSSTTTDTGGAGGGTTTSATLVTTTSSTSSTTTTTTPDTGPTELTVVNGVIDYDAVRFCFLPDDTPWPSAATGLPFARSGVIAPLAPIIPTAGDVTPWVIGGDLTKTAGKTCAQILALAAAPGATVVAHALGLIPPVVWTSHRSILLVAQGCLGGATHDDLQARLACGASYTPSTPTAGITLVGMSRQQDAAHVSLQVVSASPAIATDLDVRVLPSFTGATALDVANLSPGAIGPVPPFTQLTANEYGALDAVVVQAYPYGASTPVSVKLPDIFAGGSVGAADFVDGARLVLVGVGAAPGVAAAKWWRGFTFALVKAEPM